MKERPILFSGPMVRAILEGTKTMTRRVVDRDFWDDLEDGLPSDQQRIETDETPMGGLLATRFCKHGQPGDRLWVREAFAPIRSAYGNAECFWYRADDHASVLPVKYKPSIHMPRRASRITLEVTGVKVERVQDIREEDAFYEGVTPIPGPVTDPDGSQHLNWCREYREGFESLWDSINAARGYGWAVNPWVWAISFRRVS